MTSIKKTPQKLRRYTDLASGLHILRAKKITLLDPSRWDDGNDRICMERYKEALELQTLLAICFADCKETYHHWRVFTVGASGVCFEFDRDKLCESVSGLDGVRWQNVEYRKLDILRSSSKRWLVSELPFLKRAPYEPEQELRIIYSSATEKVETFDVPIEISWIKRVILSPWMPVALRQSVIETIRDIPGCRTLTVQSTSLVGSQFWRAKVLGAVVDGSKKR